MTTPTVGAIYKDRSRHATRVFLVTELRRIKSSRGDVTKVRGTMVTDDDSPSADSYAVDDFNKAFPFVLWAPVNG
jgi:hypothetical protein